MATFLGVPGPVWIWPRGIPSPAAMAAVHSLFEDNLRSSFAVHAEAAVGHFNHRAHGLPDGVEGVNFVELLLGDEAPDGLVILLQIQDKPQEATLCLIAHLARQPALFFWWLERGKQTNKQKK